MSNYLVENVYYDCQNYNSTAGQVKCQSSDQLLYPLLKNSDNYNIALTKAKIPIDTVPLTMSNIPLKTYQITITDGQYTSSAYVPQINSNTNNYLYTSSNIPIIEKSQYTSTAVTPNSSQDFTSVVQTISQMLVDDYENYYISGSNSTNGVTDTLYIIGQNGVLITTLTFNNIKSIHLSEGLNLYVGDDNSNGIGTSTVSIFSNMASLNSVNLNLMTTLIVDFNNNPLTNISFVVGESDYIIVGHDFDIFTYYNSTTYEPISNQIQSTPNIISAQINQNAGTFIVSTSSLSSDSLLGTSSNQISDVQTSTVISSGASIESKMTVLNNGNGYAIGTDGNTYQITYPSVTYPQTWTQINSSITSRGITSDGYSIYTIDGGDTLQCLNQGGSNNNQYYQMASNVFVAGNHIVDMDINRNNNIMYAIGSDANLYKSDNQILPLNFVSIQNGQAKVYGNTMTPAVNDPTPPLITTHTNTHNDIIEMVKIGEYFYTIEGAPNNQSVNIRNCSDFSLVTTFFVAGTDNNLNGISYSVVTNFILVCSGITCYVLDSTGVQQSVLTSPSSLSMTSTCDLNFGVSCICDTENMYIYDVGASATLLTYAIPNVQTVIQITSDTVTRINDTSQIFILFKNSTNTYDVVKILFNLSYASVLSNTLVYNDTFIYNISCNPVCGLLYMFFRASTSILLALNNYTLTGAKAVNFQAMTLASTFISVFPDLTGTLSFTKLNTTNPTFAMNSVACSITGQNLFVIGSSDNLIYSAPLSSTLDFTRVTQYINEYAYISDFKNAYTNGNSTLYLYNLNNQTLVTSVVLNGEKVEEIARNVINNEYLVPLTNANLITSYNPTSLVQNYQLALTDVNLIYAKNGSDISAGDYSIYFMKQLIDAINATFVLIYTELKSQGALLQTAPVMTLNYTTGLLTLTYDPVLANINNSIEFNTALMTICAFSNISNVITLSESGSITQNQKTIYKFNRLDKLLFATTTIFVNGNYYGPISSNRVITDIDCLTDEWIDNIGIVIYFQPALLRPYTMYSNLSLDKIDLNIYYSYTDFTNYQLYLNPQQAFSAKLNFIKKY